MLKVSRVWTAVQFENPPGQSTVQLGSRPTGLVRERQIQSDKTGYGLQQWGSPRGEGEGIFQESPWLSNKRRVEIKQRKWW